MGLDRVDQLKLPSRLSSRGFAKTTLPPLIPTRPTMHFHKHYPDWSLLLPELLQTISEKAVTSVTDYADHIRFRAVCRRWRSALSPRPLHHFQQLLWLMLPYPNYGNVHSAFLFYDLFAKKFHYLDLPETRAFEVCGSSQGWLILHKDFQLFLLNPITHDVIDLPDFTGPPFPLGIPPPHAPNGELFFQNWDSNRYVVEPITSGCLVFVHATNLWQLSFCKIGDDHWTVIEFEYNPLEFPYDDEFVSHYIDDFTYNSSNGFLYTINRLGNVAIYNLNTPSRVLLNCTVEEPGSMYLVDGSSPEILLVDYFRDPQSEPDYIAYKLSSGEEPKWIEVWDIGQNVIFVGGNEDAIFLSSANLELPRWGTKNCLYFDSIDSQMYHQGQSLFNLHTHSIKLLGLYDGKITAITSDLVSFQKNRLCPTSLWLTPTLH